MAAVRHKNHLMRLPLLPRAVKNTCGTVMWHPFCIFHHILRRIARNLLKKIDKQLIQEEGILYNVRYDRNVRIIFFKAVGWVQYGE